MTKTLTLAAGLLCLSTVALKAQDPVVTTHPPQVDGSRAVEKSTEASVVRDYLLAWKTLNTALDSNDPSLLGAYFVGTARDKLINTIDEQSKIGLHTRYKDRTHDLQIVFYSPEGLSIQLIDTVEYDEEVLSQDKVLTTKPIKKRYLVVLTPSEVRWRVRIFQAEVS